MIEYLKKELLTQDNLGTENPFYIVFEKKMQLVPKNHSDEYIWLKEDNVFNSDDEVKEYLLIDCEIPKEEVDKLDFEWDNELEIEYYKFRKEYYIELDIFNQAFLTRKGAEDYLNINSHNLRKPYIYVWHMWRNEEMKAIRKYFMELKNE